MTTRTRYFVIVSLLILGIGVGTGLVAYYVGFQPGGLSVRRGPDELELLPRDATLVAYANVQDVMVSEVRQKLLRALPGKQDGHREFQNLTGINIETDIDQVVACLAPSRDANQDAHPSGLVLARGRFDEARIEALMREHGARVESYQGRRLIVATRGDASAGDRPDSPGGSDRKYVGPFHGEGLSVAFIEPGLAAVGSTGLVRHAIDLKSGGGENVRVNGEMMNLVRSLESGNVWALGRFDALSSQAKFPAAVARQLPPITWFSASGHINGGVRAVLRAETRDAESANGLRDVVRGIIALAKMQGGSRPEMQVLLRSLDLGGTGTTVALSFELPAELFDALGAAVGQVEKQPGQ
jgi:hypothetical protein